MDVQARCAPEQAMRQWEPSLRLVLPTQHVLIESAIAANSRETALTIYILCLLIGIIAGLRTMTALAAVSWAAAIGGLHLGPTWLAFLGYRWTPYVLTLLALGELATDKLPSTPSRTVPIQLGARIAAGALSGAAIGMAHDVWLVGGVLGIVGALLGTFAGAGVRGKLADAFGRDLPAGIFEDAVAVGGGALVVFALS